MREAGDEICFGDDEVALKDGIGDGADDADFELAAGAIEIDQVVADFFAEGPLDGGGVADGRNDVGAEIGIEKSPWVF